MLPELAHLAIQVLMSLTDHIVSSPRAAWVDSAVFFFA